MKLVTALAAVSIAVLSTACAAPHRSMRGSVVMRVSDSDAHVCLGNEEVAVGDHVDLVRHKCSPTSDKSVAAVDRCKREVVASGEVVEVLNSHYSVVRFPAGTPFAEGDSIEKSK